MKIKGKMTPWAKWLTARLNEEGWSLAELCRRCGGNVDHSTLRYQIREGRRPHALVVQCVEKAFGKRFPGWT